MRISMKALSFSVGILWGSLMLVVGSVNLVVPSYGTDFLRLMSSIYPGADTTATLGSVLLGALYGFVDGAICGLVLGFLYEAFSHEGTVMQK